MDKKIKIAGTGLFINSSTVMIVEINQLSFEKDERYPWLKIYALCGENKEFLEEIDTRETSNIVTLEKIKTFPLNWFFNNVEIVKELKEDKLC